MPSWRKPDGTAAKPGDGWVYCAYQGVRLRKGKYKSARCRAGYQSDVKKAIVTLAPGFTIDVTTGL